MAKYQYKGAEQPELIGKVYEGVRVPPADEDLDAFEAWADHQGLRWEDRGRDGLLIPTPAGPRPARPGDWVLKSALGAFCPVTPGYFEENFAPYKEGA